MKASSSRRVALVQAVFVMGFLAVCSSYYRPGAGLTQLIGFSAAWHDRELQAVRDVPHYDDPGPGYDGRFYAQLATDPLVIDPAIDHALDAPVLRARRVLLSWTAWILGAGQPGMALHIYSVLNIAAWLALAWTLRRWIPPTGGRNLALWAGSLAGYGALASVRFSLTDLPCVLLLALAVRAAAQSRHMSAGLSIGVASLARETGLIALVLPIHSWARRFPGWPTALGVAGLAVGPLALWHLYLAGTHPWRIIEGAGNVGLPLVGAGWKIADIAASLGRDGVTLPVLATLAGLAGFATQGGVAIRAMMRPGTRTTWAMLAATSFAFTLCTQEAPWSETPGAYLRLALPLAVGANVILATTRSGWLVVTAANLGVVPGLLLFVCRWI